ncbi:hypothetical protein KIK84_13030 [Curvibacter sp. CHRR-16]|uniref:DUF3227 domain-containing protein n=1 Tax=Curvibacter sp. CHRR-16 TaxID=2835872 RepID=UPI001BD924E9|nr:DUF3227 domain-containing protein [Curvibacter sp. CHRR-16]MBT0571251.1 hypothetical protein [Curvibacter sp. CHRR-16]
MTSPQAGAPKQAASATAKAPSTASSAPKSVEQTKSTTLVVGMPCEVANGPTSAVVLMCKPDEAWWEKGLLTLPSLITSIAALILSGLAYKYNRAKDQRARKQSISDDFWLRKVVSPVAIEPFVKFVISLSSTLPSTTSSAEDTKKFWAAGTTNFGEFSASFFNLELISADLHKEVATLLEAMEDEFSDYCGALQQYLNDNTQPVPDHKQTLLNLGKTSRAMMQAIAKFQANVGDD